MKTVATIIAMLLTLPISYAMLDEVVRKIRLKDRWQTSAMPEREG